MSNGRKSPVIDAELSEYLVEKNLNLSASTDLKVSIIGVIMGSFQRPLIRR